MTSAPAKPNHDPQWGFTAAPTDGHVLPTVQRVADALSALATALPPEKKQPATALLLTTVRACADATMREHGLARGFCHDLWQHIHGQPVPVYMGAIRPEHFAGMKQMADLAGCWPECFEASLFQAVTFIPLAEWRELTAQRLARGNKCWPFPEVSHG